MQVIDKLLLGLMVLLLPIGLFVSTKIGSKGGGVSKVSEDVQTQRLEKLIQETVAANHAGALQAEPISIAAVSFATESATIKTSGKAPKGNANVLVSVTVIPATGVEELGDQEVIIDSVKGTGVDTVSVSPLATGDFVFEYDLPDGLARGIVEMRLEQDLSVRTVRFDVGKRVQVL